jgi:hypothetical protein
VAVVTHERALSPARLFGGKAPVVGSWSLHWPSGFWSTGANFEFASAYAAQVHYSCASLTAGRMPFFVFERVLT